MNVTTDRKPVIPAPGTLRLSSKEGQLSVTDPNGRQATVVGSAPTLTTGAAAVTNVVSLSQAAYDALATKDATTLYVITA